MNEPSLPSNIEQKQLRPYAFLQRRSRISALFLLSLSILLLIVATAISVGYLSPLDIAASHPAITTVTVVKKTTPTATPTPAFNPNLNAVLPTHRIVAFYAIPGASATGPAYQLDAGMLAHLKTQGAAYQALDPAHPVQLGIDLVASVPDGFPGPDNTYSHHLDPATIQQYIDFCQQNNLLLFLDLNFGWAPIMPEVNFFLPYLEKYSFVHMAIDPEWMFPRHDGIPGYNLSNVRASDLNPIIKAVAAIPMAYHVPRKILIIHQYRPSGDLLRTPFDAGQAEIADKRNLISDQRVDTVIHVDSVGGYPNDHRDKIQQYGQWVHDDMQSYHNFSYGGFKLFYNIEARTGVMTPAEVLALNPAPMVVTYGN
ncbi:hypothetical protein [Dictyobacter arantiisoli]|uniref:Lipoprotein n=1 Tax=Dictyobacter arantiisoli TaxID=2014874 RepID=A0A5A5T9U6_9CHLR|nr:hypothetical protein [Dictyobacter arantiisoli]GCF08192.1 hypothetical protein KDI_17560 [Dictyobacter arantiisoli]